MNRIFVRFLIVTNKAFCSLAFHIFPGLGECVRGALGSAHYGSLSPVCLIFSPSLEELEHWFRLFSSSSLNIIHIIAVNRARSTSEIYYIKTDVEIYVFGILDGKAPGLMCGPRQNLDIRN